MKDAVSRETAVKSVLIVCYHSRFRLCDRRERHNEVVAEFQRKPRRAALAITTQVCEMSLDLDADVLISEVAPVTALIQRMGRCCREQHPGKRFGEVYLYDSQQVLPYEKIDIEQGNKFRDELARQTTEAPARVDYEYERKGVCHQLMMCEPLRGWRHVKLSEHRTRCNYAQCVRELLDVHYPRARTIRLVQDILNTHDGASLYQAFAPEQGRRILNRIEFHYTPKHGSWLNMAETEINLMLRQWLDRRLDSQALIAKEVATWEKQRNARRAKIHWTFTLASARRKLQIYPSVED
jgi:hypothetical protein